MLPDEVQNGRHGFTSTLQSSPLPAVRLGCSNGSKELLHSMQYIADRNNVHRALELARQRYDSMQELISCMMETGKIVSWAVSCPMDFASSCQRPQGAWTHLTCYRFLTEAWKRGSGQHLQNHAHVFLGGDFCATAPHGQAQPGGRKDAPGRDSGRRGGQGRTGMRR